MGIIKQANEVQFASNVCMLIYGKPGIGKTTLALSSPNCLYLDFEGSGKRIDIDNFFNIGTVQVSEWGDIRSVFEQKQYNGYKTIVIDTVESLLKLVINYVCGSRQPQIRDWGNINYQVEWFITEAKKSGLNIVFISHRTTYTDRDIVKYTPDVRPKTYTSIANQLDLQGFMDTDAKEQRTIMFGICSYADTKNTIKLSEHPIVIPKLQYDEIGCLVNENDFLQRAVFDVFAKYQKQKADNVKRYTETVANIRKNISEIKDADDANMFMGYLMGEEFPKIGNSEKLARNLFSAKVKELNLTFNKETKQYEPAA